jgi:hypothetical protein
VSARRVHLAPMRPVRCQPPKARRGLAAAARARTSEQRKRIGVGRRARRGAPDTRDRHRPILVRVPRRSPRLR